MVIVVVVVAATAATVASFDHLVRHRELAGATWSAAFLPPDGQDLDRALEQARAVPGVRAATTTGWDTPDGLLVNGQAVDIQVFGDDGEIRPAIRHGRAPAALVNGLGSQCINYRTEWCQRFVDKGFHVVRMDNRDVGLSTHFSDVAPDVMGVVAALQRGEPAEVPYTLSDMAADVVAVLDASGWSGPT